MPSPLRVLIIGGGPGGLALAQGLKSLEPSISLSVFERSPKTSFRAQGYRVRLTPDGCDALQKLLPPSLWPTFKTTCPEFSAEGGGPINALTGEAIDSSGPRPKLPRADETDKIFNVDRGVFRNLLMTGLEENITFEKSFERYTVLPDGTIEARFTDGSTAVGDVLVGADGMRSRVRRQFLPDLTVVDTEGRALFGKTYLTPEIEALVPGKLTEGTCVVAADRESPVKLFCEPMRFTQRDAARAARWDLPPDYFYWAFLFKPAQVEGEIKALADNLQALSQEEIVRLGVGLTRDWAPSVRAIVERQEARLAGQVPMFAVVPDDFFAKWGALVQTDRPENVTLLGDAAHPMLPVGGHGANAALQEAAGVLEALRNASQTPEATSIELRKYEDAMRHREKSVLDMLADQMLKGGLFKAGPLGDLKPVDLWT